MCFYDSDVVRSKNYVLYIFIISFPFLFLFLFISFSSFFDVFVCIYMFILFSKLNLKQRTKKTKN